MTLVAVFPVPISLVLFIRTVRSAVVALRALPTLLCPVHAICQQTGTGFRIEAGIFRGGAGPVPILIRGAQLRPLLPHLGGQVGHPLLAVHQPRVAEHQVAFLWVGVGAALLSEANIVQAVEAAGVAGSRRLTGHLQLDDAGLQLVIEYEDSAPTVV